MDFDVKKEVKYLQKVMWIGGKISKTSYRATYIRSAIFHMDTFYSNSLMECCSLLLSLAAPTGRFPALLLEGRSPHLYLCLRV